MLCCGGFRSAYQKARKLSEKKLYNLLLPYYINKTEIIKKYKQREYKSHSNTIQKIPGNETWMAGYLSGKSVEKDEGQLIKQYSNYRMTRKEQQEIMKFLGYLNTIRDKANSTFRKALKNTDIYLEKPFMDVYIATSMRNKWEYNDTSILIEKIFNDPIIKRLKLHYFDPTQSVCRNRLDKGLIEALMLKRVNCTIYMVQETDTMGKDSELATTLIQGKPVIAFVPEIIIRKRIQIIKNYPLSYFERIYHDAKIQKFFSDDKYSNKFNNYNITLKKSERYFSSFNEKYSIHFNRYPYILWEKKDVEFKEKNRRLMSFIYLITAIIESIIYDYRADVLKEGHPLSMQTTLSTGVANGLLVVRSYNDCVKLLHSILVNNLNFTIKQNDGITILEEKISKCPFRLVTDNAILTNSFWRYYLHPTITN